jgi:hypothetical protein
MPRFPNTPVTMLHTFRVLLLLPRISSVPALAQDERELTEEARKQYAEAPEGSGRGLGTAVRESREEKLNALLAKRPREPRARFLKGVVEAEQGHVDAAMSAFRWTDRGLSRASGTVQQPRGLLAQRGEFDKRQVALETAVRTAPDWSVAARETWATSTPASPRSSMRMRRSSTRQQDRAGEARAGARSSRQRSAAETEDVAVSAILSPERSRSMLRRPFLIAALLLAAIFAVPALRRQSAGRVRHDRRQDQDRALSRMPRRRRSRTSWTTSRRSTTTARSSIA